MQHFSVALSICGVGISFNYFLPDVTNNFLFFYCFYSLTDRRYNWWSDTYLVRSKEKIELPRLGVHRQAAHEQGAHLEKKTKMKKTDN